MHLPALTSAVALTTITFTLSSTPTWSQTKTNPHKLMCSSIPYPGCVENITTVGLTPEQTEKHQRIIAGKSESLPKTLWTSAKNSPVVSQGFPEFYSQNQSNPNDAAFYINRGVVYLNQQKWDLALADFNQAIAINPNLAEAYMGRGGVYVNLGDIKKARENFQRSAELFLTQGNTAGYELAIRLLNSL